jgi:hypothetical protein
MSAVVGPAGFTQNAVAQEREPGEYQVKAAFLFNFAKFIEWPSGAFSDPAAPIIFGVLGDDPFRGALEAAQGRTVKGRKVLIARYKDVRDIKVCHILFISSSERRRLPELMSTLKDSKMLLVGDMEKFADRGGIINFFVRDNKVGFEINMDAATRAGFTINSRLLNMATIVHGAPGREDN